MSRDNALRQVWAACRSRDLKKLTAVLREHAAELEGALDTHDLDDEQQNTALTFAAVNTYFSAGVEVLLKAGASVDKKIREGVAPLTKASLYGIDENIAVLLKFGASINQTTDDGSTALLLAASGKPWSVPLLLKHGASVEMADDLGRTPFIVASQNAWGPHMLSLLELLLEHKANLNAVDNEGANALHQAAFADQPEACLLLISHGLDPAATDNLGWSALSHYGCFLDGNVAEDEDDEDTRPELSPEAKTERRALLVAAREAFLLQQQRDANWKRRFPFLDTLVGSKLRATGAVAAQQKLAQASADTSAKLPVVPRFTKEQNRDYLHGAIFGNDALVRKIVEYL
jgi:ankyrin repeat protein